MGELLETSAGYCGDPEPGKEGRESVEVEKEKVCRHVKFSHLRL